MIFDSLSLNRQETQSETFKVDQERQEPVSLGYEMIYHMMFLLPFSNHIVTQEATELTHNSHTALCWGMHVMNEGSLTDLKSALIQHTHSSKMPTKTLKLEKAMLPRAAEHTLQCNLELNLKF